MIYHFPPTVTADAIEYAPIKGVSPPKVHIGYKRDPQNPWRQINEWEPCSKREAHMRPRECGRALITYYCQNTDCPLFKRILNPADCGLCNHAVEPVISLDTGQ
jgi:hypothetical protein